MRVLVVLRLVQSKSNMESMMNSQTFVVSYSYSPVVRVDRKKQNPY
jgi:hypothetical protein